MIFDGHDFQLIVAVYRPGYVTLFSYSRMFSCVSFGLDSIEHDSFDCCMSDDQ